ncbi:hypothetical protein GCM10028806_41590 [Spirosoma terrae]
MCIVLLHQNSTDYRHGFINPINNSVLCCSADGFVYDWPLAGAQRPEVLNKFSVYGCQFMVVSKTATEDYKLKTVN